MALTLLRHLPHVEIFEYRYAEKGGVWVDHGLWAADISDELFGISEYDVEDFDEVLFKPVLTMMRDESDAYWAKHGWDVTDGNGKQLEIMRWLTRPMVCLVEKLHPAAEFTMAAETWASQLEAEAKAFRPSR